MQVFKTSHTVIENDIDYLTAAIEGEQLEIKTNVSKYEVDTRIREV